MFIRKKNFEKLTNINKELEKELFSIEKAYLELQTKYNYCVSLNETNALLITELFGKIHELKQELESYQNPDGEFLF